MSRSLFFVALIVGAVSLGAQQPPQRERLAPVFTQENRSLIFIEGEAAVTTNFNRESTLNYGCSGSRTLQLNRTTALQGPFYAEYAFYVEEAGRYELWYGGTPPGPKDKLLPSFASPIHAVVDDGGALDVYRETVKVAAQYTPSYYWNLVSEVELAAGRHTLRFEVSEKRDYDGRFYFYLDCFFLVRKEKGTHVVGTPRPALFPKDLDVNAGREIRFRAIEDYQITIRDNPKSAEAHVELAFVYTLVGDYLNALKHLRLAQALDPDNVELLVLQAKNQIWKGEIEAGLETYRKLLLQQPARLDIWSEAGKVAAWTGRYEESIGFYESGLRQFKDSKDLVVNLGLALLWASREREAGERFAEARRFAGNDYEQLKALAGVYELNGVPDRAAAAYRDVVRAFPDRLEPYLLLYETLRKGGRLDEAKGVRDQIAVTFVPSPELDRRLDVFWRRQDLTEERIAEYQSRLSQHPDDLELRMVLAQALFWNGLRQRAIAEYGNILANSGYRAFAQMDQDAMDLLRLADRALVQHAYLSGLSARIAEHRRALAAEQAEARAAGEAWEAFQKKVAAAREKGEAPPKPEGRDPQERVREAEKRLAAAVGRTRALAAGHRDIVAAFAQEMKELERIKGVEAKEEEVFFNIVKVSRWEWDRREFEREMGELAAKGQPLAHYVIGRVRQINGDPDGAERSYRAAGDAPLAAARFALLETLLWQGRGRDAIKLAASFGTEVAQAYPYLHDLLDVVQRTDPAGEPGPSDAAAVDAAAAALTSLEADARAGQGEAEGAQRELRSLLAKRLRRTVYFLEESTVAFRRELGDFYLTEKNPEGAIRQYRAVLAIDPWDTASIYRLGTVYERKGDWMQAMRSFERVYASDPQYENAAALYNQLARAHSQALELATRTFADTSKIQFDADATWRQPFSPVVGLDLTYHTETVRLYTPGYAGEDRVTYQLHKLEAAVPLTPSDTRLKVAPRAGVDISHRLYSEGSAAPDDIPDFLSQAKADPVLGVDVELVPLPWLTLTGGYQWGRNAETFVPLPTRGAVYSHTAEVGVTTTLAFLPPPVLNGSSLRTYGKAEALSDGNLLYQGAEELALVVLHMSAPDTTVRLVANGYFEDSTDRDPAERYYAPDSVLTVEGGLAGSTWIPVGSGRTLGINARVTTGLAIEDMLTSSETTRRWKVEGEASVELGLGEGSLYLGAQAAHNFVIESALASADDYWSLSLRLGFVTRLPRVLAP